LRHRARNGMEAACFLVLQSRGDGATIHMQTRESADSVTRRARVHLHWRPDAEHTLAD
jgi:hypothetical protein